MPDSIQITSTTDSPEHVEEQRALENGHGPEEVQMEREREENGNGSRRNSYTEREVKRAVRERGQARDEVEQLRQQLARVQADSDGARHVESEDGYVRLAINDKAAEEEAPADSTEQGAPEFTAQDQELMAAHHERVTKLIEADPELKAKVAELEGESDPEFHSDVAREIRTSKNSAEVVAYLIKNPEAAQQIASASPEQGKQAIQEISEGLAGESGQEAKREPGKQGRAEVSKEFSQRVKVHLDSLPVEVRKKLQDQPMSLGLWNAIVPALQDIDGGEKVVVYLAQHPEELKKMHGLKSAAAAVAYVGSISARLEGNGARPVISSAPAPIAPLRGNSVRQAVDLSAPDVDFQTYKRERQKQEDADRVARYGRR
ncbi:MAG TPA: hypothetical protein VNH65_03220 [Candidatus Acidoferrum sp.]|nr:hypothetical protein [Candidatus Acidoferrum sp.]